MGWEGVGCRPVRSFCHECCVDHTRGNTQQPWGQAWRQICGRPLVVGGAPCGETPKEGLTSGRLLMPSREDGVGLSASEAGPSPAATGEARAERSAQLQGPCVPLQHPPAPLARAWAGKEAA